MNIDKNKIKQFKKITRNFVLAGTLSALMLVSPTFMTSAKAIEPVINPNGYYDISDDGYYAQIVGNVDYSKINSNIKANEIYVSNATIDSSFSFKNSSIKHIIFSNCNFTSANFENLQNINTYSFIGCKFDNLDFLSKCNNITNLNFDSCEVGNVDAIKNLDSLESINFYDVGIENIDFLRDKKNLTELILVNTCVSDLTPIKNSNIGFLDISNTTSIQDLSSVLTLNNLYAFYSKNCEMAYTEELYNFVKSNNIESNIKIEDFKIKNDVKKIANKIITSNMTNEEKIFSVVNYVVDNVEYDYEVETNQDLSTKYNTQALTYALQGVGCCKNYTALTTALLQIVGIETYEIKGNNHIWNLIELEGEYYWIDSTWLDGLDDAQILESNYYMNNDPLFIGHDQLTLPVSMYDDVYGKPNDIVIQIDKNEFEDNANYIDDEVETLEITTENSEPSIESESSTITQETQTKAENEQKIESTTNKVVISENESQYISKNLQARKASVGAIVGIALALGCAKVANTKKKNSIKSKTK